MTFIEKIYWLGVESYLEKEAQHQRSMGYPEPEESLYDSYIKAKHKHDPYFSTALGGALGAGLGAFKGKTVGAIGGGAGALLGLSLAKRKEQQGQ